jgi:hypothetical protein
VDILKGNANPFDTGSSVLVSGLYPHGVDPRITNPNPYTNYTYDLTSTLGRGGTFILRFADVHNQADLNTVLTMSLSTSRQLFPEPSRSPQRNQPSTLQWIHIWRLLLRTRLLP